jgi:hypothetical protein
MVQPYTNQFTLPGGNPKSAATEAARTESSVRVSRFEIPLTRRMATLLCRFALTALVAFVLFAGSAFLRGNGAAHASATPLTIRVTVGQGESLWSLARQYGNPDENIQDRIDTLSRANAMPAGSPLLTGQRLLVPVGNPMLIARLQTTVAARR